MKTYRVLKDMIIDGVSSDQFLIPIGASVDLGDDPTFVGFGEL
jgi:hypothetical protein